MAKDYDKEDGVWRTIGGRKVFIRKGQNLADAMKESGKFKSNKKNEKQNNVDETEKELDKKYDEAHNEKELDDFDEEENKRNKPTNDERTDRQKELDDINKQIKDLDNSYRKGNVDNLHQLDRELLYDKKSALENEINGTNEKERLDQLMKDLRDISNKTATNKSTNEQFDVSDLKKKAQQTLPKDDIDTYAGDLYIKKTKESDELLKNLKSKDNSLITTFRDQQTGETWYDIPFANWEDDYKEKTGRDDWNEQKSTNETMNNAIREKANKSNTIPRDYEKITYTQKIDTNAGKKGDKFELYKDEDGNTHTKNLRTGETYQANMSMMKSPEAVEINDVVKKQTSNKILNDSQLRKMKWEDVVKANTDYYIEKSIYDFEGGRQGKYKYEDGWRDNGGAGVIKQSDLDRLIDKEDWERANKGYGRKYDSVDEAIKDKDSALNQYIRNKADEKKAYKQYLKEHPNSKMSLKEFRNMNK